jgi:hypothetical protein
MIGDDLIGLYALLLIPAAFVILLTYGYFSRR